jgi:hypothetical protein
VKAMAFVFDLTSYEVVRLHALDIYERVSEGTMPCDIQWPEERVRLFSDWINGGMKP